MLWHSFEQLIVSIESFELADVPAHLVSNEIAGVVSLPVQAKLPRVLKDSLAVVDGGRAPRWSARGSRV
jgi:hypothetical protein